MGNSAMDRIDKANNSIKNFNIDAFEKKLSLGEVSVKDIKNLLEKLQPLVQEYISSENIEALYSIATNKNNGTNLEYRKVNSFPYLQEVIDEFNRPIPNVETMEKDSPYELAKMAFWFNKVTKIVCRPEKQRIKNNCEEGEYNKIQQYYTNIIHDDNFETEKNLYEEDENFRKNFYEYCKVMKAEDFSYFIKDVLIRTLFSSLVKDNYQKYKLWGFYRDKNEKLVFAMDFLR